MALWHKLFLGPTLLLLALGFMPRYLSSQTYTASPIYNFCPMGSCSPTEGVQTNLIQAWDGNFYGWSLGGAASGLFRVTPTGDYSVVHTFAGFGGIIQGGDGNLYGTTEYGGANNEGEVFRISLGGTYTTLYNFCSLANCADGQNPGDLIEGSDGNYYGGTANTAYKISPSGKMTILFGSGVGIYTQATDGNLYGVTASESGCLTSSCESIVKLTPSGTLTTLHTFCMQDNCPDGEVLAALVQGSDGNFYGTTEQYGVTSQGGQGEGTAFVITPAGSLTTLYVFCSLSNCADGSNPTPSLVAGSDGNFYGTTEYGGPYESEVDEPINAGTVFELNPTDTSSPINTVFAFCPPNNNCTAGDQPLAGVAEGSDGSFYGTTFGGGAENGGTIYKLAAMPALPAPVQVSLSSSHVMPGKPVTASLKVLNAFSLTMQQCYAFQNGTPLGKVPGSYNSQTKLYTFSSSFTPATAGIYNYAVTCGGVESGFATLTVGDTTKTTLAAAPNPVTPPANVTLTATVMRTTGSGVPSGTVTFAVGTTVLGKAGLNDAGVATLTASSKGVPAGTYPVVATYSGDANDISSASAALDVTVQ
jgi:uncharacterized repeat protein (TIGR03803 family)